MVCIYYLYEVIALNIPILLELSYGWGNQEQHRFKNLDQSTTNATKGNPYTYLLGCTGMNYKYSVYCFNHITQTTFNVQQNSLV